MANNSKKRLDERLVEGGFFESKEAALRSVIAGEVLIDDVPATSAAQMVDGDAGIRLRGKRRTSGRFVSRGGDKLKSALDEFGISVAGKRCIDIGSSTGGFTDCLLQHGAQDVACVDVNYGQLAWKIREDGRTRVFERTNIKAANPLELGAPFDVIAIDVSFIGLAGLAPVISRYASEGTVLLALVKPQFESKHDETVRGVVESEEVRARTVEEVRCALAENGFSTVGVMESPVKGPAGNIEYLIYAVFEQSV